MSLSILYIAKHIAATHTSDVFKEKEIQHWKLQRGFLYSSYVSHFSLSWLLKIIEISIVRQFK